MLCYLGGGTRHYAEKPVRAYRRPYWEFQAVIAGRIAMEDETGTLPLRRSHLWLSAPGHLHGWTGEAQKPAEIAVFHFLRIPEPLAKKSPIKRTSSSRLRPARRSASGTCAWWWAGLSRGRARRCCSGTSMPSWN